LTVEGFPATKMAYKLALDLEMKGKLSVKVDLPLLSMIHRILYENGNAEKEIASFVSKIG
jgi:glycerol-3-phosphate dehydrogenase